MKASHACLLASAMLASACAFSLASAGQEPGLAPSAQEAPPAQQQPAAQEPERPATPEPVAQPEPAATQERPATQEGAASEGAERAGPPRPGGPGRTGRRGFGGRQRPQEANGTPAGAQLPAEWMQALEWRSIGPANMGGRITALAVYEKDPVIWWAATASGGLLKTENDGRTFVHQFDREATVAIGDVAVAQSDPQIVWVGTGEANPRNSVSWGNGVYKSTDGGATWKNMGLENSFQIGAVAIHPENPEIVYVAALGRLWGPSEERGLYKTADGGASWERILYVDERGKFLR